MKILLTSGRAEEAYQRYALAATRGTSYLATYRALARKYPQKRPEELLGDLVATTPADEGKWSPRPRRWASSKRRSGSQIRTLVASETSGGRFVSRTLGRALGL